MATLRTQGNVKPAAVRQALASVYFDHDAAYEATVPAMGRVGSDFYDWSMNRSLAQQGRDVADANATVAKYKKDADTLVLATQQGYAHFIAKKSPRWLDDVSSVQRDTRRAAKMQKFYAEELAGKVFPGQVGYAEDRAGNSLDYVCSPHEDTDGNPFSGVKLLQGCLDYMQAEGTKRALDVLQNASLKGKIPVSDYFSAIDRFRNAKQRVISENLDRLLKIKPPKEFPFTHWFSKQMKDFPVILMILLPPVGVALAVTSVGSAILDLGYQALYPLKSLAFSLKKEKLQKQAHLTGKEGISL